MSSLGFKQDKKIIDYIQSDSFTLSAEVIPPRNGTDQGKVLNQVEKLVDHGAEFLSVTKGAGGSLRGGSLPIAQIVKERFDIPCIAHFTCRDLVPQEIENQLMDHHYFGIRNILALRGDPPSDQPGWEPTQGTHHYAYQLIEQIRRLNQGEYIPRPGRRKTGPQEPTDFCIGAAVYPEHPCPNERLEFFRKKLDAGAEYAITQMIFDERAYCDFVERCMKQNMNAPILPGTRILKSKEQAQRMAERFGCSIPKEMIRQLPADAESSPERCVDVFLSFTEKLKRHGAPGIHIFVLSDTANACTFFRTLSSQTQITKHHSNIHHRGKVDAYGRVENQFTEDKIR